MVCFEVMRLGDAKWPELKDLRDKVFVAPLGSLEQHAYHLPLWTDSSIVTAIADRVEQARADRIVLAPTQWVGHSPHHRRLGCVSMDLRPYMELVESICRSLVRIGARRILLLNGHGGNDIPCKAALRELKSEFEGTRDLYIVYATYWNLAAQRMSQIRSSPPGGMGHACEMETSVMLAIAPESVAMKKAVDVTARDPGGRALDMLQKEPYFLIEEFDEVSPSGGIGLPSHATEEKGRQFLEAAVSATVAFIDEFAQWPERQG